MNEPAVKPKIVRCAIYTRKSTEEGLNQEFNSLDAQREAAESYIQSQKSEGWICLPELYDDGGYTGGNIDRPALAKLIKHVEAGRIDCVVVYKVDRLSRSLLDFSTLISAFDKHKVTFVSVTQSFNTTSSMGRLTLNILLSFAQFEREIIGERIRDKIAAAKRKGKYTGGTPIFGYDVKDSKLVANAAEAKTVRDIFRRFLILRSPLKVMHELNEQGISAKSWITRKGKHRVGRSWNKNMIRQLLGNCKYIGEVGHNGHIYKGEQEAIIDRKTWDYAQAILQENSHSRANATRSQTPAMLKGLLRCGHCGGALGITYTKRKGRSYRYYHCIAASKRGRDSCPVKSVPAGEIEAMAVTQLREMLRAPETLAMAHREFSQEHAPCRDGETPENMIENLEASKLPEQNEFAQALGNIDAVWEHLFPAEQARICRLLIDRITIRPGDVSLRLRTCGLYALFSELRPSGEEKESNNHV